MSSWRACPRRLVPLPRRSSACTVTSPGRREGGGQAVQLGGRGEGPVEEDDLARPRARHPPADGVAAGPRELTARARRRGAPARHRGGACPPAVRGRASRRTKRAGTLNPARRPRTWAVRAPSPGSSAPSSEDDRGDRDVPQLSSGPPTTHASATAGCSSRTASTSAGLTFSPPRTMRSSRRSTTNRRPCRSRRPRSPVRNGSSAAPGQRPHRGTRRSGTSPGGRSRRPRSRPRRRWRGARREAARPRTPAVPRVLGGEGRHAGRRLRQAIGGDDRPAGPEGARDEVGRDRTAAEQRGPQGRRRRGAVALVGHAPAASAPARRGSRRGCVPWSAARSAAGHARAGCAPGTRPRIARHRIPRPAT